MLNHGLWFAAVASKLQRIAWVIQENWHWPIKSCLIVSKLSRLWVRSVLLRVNQCKKIMLVRQTFQSCSLVKCLSCYKWTFHKRLELKGIFTHAASSSYVFVKISLNDVSCGYGGSGTEAFIHSIPFIHLIHSLVPASRILLLQKADTKPLVYRSTRWHGPSQGYMQDVPSPSCSCSLMKAGKHVAECCLAWVLHWTLSLHCLPHKGDLFALENNLISLLVFTSVGFFYYFSFTV